MNREEGGVTLTKGPLASLVPHFKKRDDGGHKECKAANITEDGVHNVYQIDSDHFATNGICQLSAESRAHAVSNLSIANT